MSMEIQAKDHSSRAALDKFVKDLTDKERSGATIAGTKRELARLNLSYRTTVHGVPCVAEGETPPAPTEKPARGKVHPFGLDGSKKEAPAKKPKEVKKQRG